MILISSLVLLDAGGVPMGQWLMWVIGGILALVMLLVKGNVNAVEKRIDTIEEKHAEQDKRINENHNNLVDRLNNNNIVYLEKLDSLKDRIAEMKDNVKKQYGV